MQFAQSKLIPSKNFSESFNIMASESEKTSESESEIVNLETQDLSNEKKKEENSEMEMISNPEKSKQSKACEEDPYIVKLFKSLMKPESQKNSVEKKK